MLVVVAGRFRASAGRSPPPWGASQAVASGTRNQPPPAKQTKDAPAAHPKLRRLLWIFPQGFWSFFRIAAARAYSCASPVPVFQRPLIGRGVFLVGYLCDSFTASQEILDWHQSLRCPSNAKHTHNPHVGWRGPPFIHTLACDARGRLLKGRRDEFIQMALWGGIDLALFCVAGGSRPAALG